MEQILTGILLSSLYSDQAKLYACVILLYTTFNYL